MLDVQGLNVFYGGIHAVRDVCLQVPSGAIVTLIGANGAGKTTILRAISGLIENRRGRISFEGREIQSLPAHRILREGVALVPEGRRVFANLSVEENLRMGAYVRPSEEAVGRDLARIGQLFPRLNERMKQKGGTLSGGEQQMLALGRGLMSRPRLLMLDEPSLGLAPRLVQEVFGILRRINEEGTDILLIEQNALAALELAHFGYVLQSGRVVLQGDGRDLLGSPMVKEAYLGKALP